MAEAPELESSIRDAYIRGVLAEMERDIRRRALSRVQVITRSMAPAEEEAYLQSKAFENTLNQTRRKDRIYQALQSSELPEGYDAEYESLRPLMRAELRAGHPVDLAFLRGVKRSRQPLKAAREAAELAQSPVPEAWLRKNAGRLAAGLDAALARALSEKNLSRFLRRADRDQGVAGAVFQEVFRKGIPREIADMATQEGSLEQYLTRKLEEAYPALGKCSRLRIGDGGTVGARIAKQVRTAEEDVIRALNGRFPAGRIRRLLSRNPSLRALQKKREQEREKRRDLQEALVKAMPERIPDLYPLARRMKRRFILHLGPTNSGKTHESIQRLHAARQGIYLGPLRLLAFEQFETLNMADVPCSLVTGEEQIAVPDSRVQSSTIEMADLEKEYDIAVIDEAQMIADRDRGGAWSAAMLGLQAEEIHVCASPDAEKLLLEVIAECGDEWTVNRHERMAPLMVEEGGFQFPGSVRAGDALIVFSRMRVHALAAELKQKGYAVSLIYGALPPDVRRDQAERFRRGETDVVVSTDAIAMGMNLPIARVVFMEAEKYDGDITRQLTDSEIRQIAGRAGRYGQYDIGYVNSFGGKSFISHALSRPMLPLTHAMIRFPESLLGLPLPLTEILNRWIGMKDSGCFTKASTVRMVSLAARMETRHTDKRLLYDFLCIPFDENDPELLNEWKQMYHAECTGTKYDVMAVLPDYLDPEQCTVGMLDGMEENYRLCDLLYNYARRFLENPENTLTAIQQRKDLISAGIIHVLSTQKLPGRKCRQCGHRLPWDWPYAVCDHCWQRFYGK